MKLGIILGIGMCILGYLGAEGFFWPVQPLADSYYFEFPFLSFMAWLIPEQQSIEHLELTTKRIALITFITFVVCSIYLLKKKSKHSQRLMLWLMPFLAPYTTFKVLWFLADNYTWY